MPTRCEQQQAYPRALVGLELLRWYRTAHVMLGRYWSDAEAGERFQGAKVPTNTGVKATVIRLVAA